MGFLGLLFVGAVVLLPVWIIFKVALTALAISFKFTFWILELVAMLLFGFFFGGGFLTLLVLMIVFNVIALPCWLLFARR